MKQKFDWNDISLVPKPFWTSESRSEIDNKDENGNLPLFVAPMDMVIDKENATEFLETGLNVCLPRNVKWDDLKDDRFFYSFGLDEIITMYDNNEFIPKKVLIDIANGHLSKLYKFSKKIKKELGDNIILMVGNIANPEAYREYCKAGVDYIRVGIGSGSACTTSANCGVHYPMASLVSECRKIGKKHKNPTKIVADGGFKNFSDINKALALGADYVMIGGILSKTLESCSDFYYQEGDNYTKITKDEALNKYNNGEDVYKYYRGMSTKEVQKSWNRKILKTSEGITKYNKVEYTLSGWLENFEDYLKSAMSYCGKKNLNKYIGKAKYIKITDNAFNRYNK